jgi:hypothetical protein
LSRIETGAMRSNDTIIDADFEPVAADAPQPGRALVTIAQASPPDTAVAYSFRPEASFIAQLIAGAANAPQTRVLRRASPEDALASYRGSAERQQNDVSPVGKTTSRVA